MLAMVHMNAATPDNAATTSDAPVAVAADDDGESAYQHPFKDDDEKTRHWSITTSGFYLGAGVKHNWDLINNSFEVGLLNIAAVNYNSLHGQNISFGIGIHHRSYSIKRPYMLERDNNNKVIVDQYPSMNVDQIKDRSSNLNMWGFQFPLLFTQRIVKKLDITVGGILNWNVNAQVDNHYKMDKIEHDTHFKGLKQNKVNFDVFGSLTWDEVGLYCRYTPGKYFKDDFGPEIKNTWTLGITLGL